MKRKFVLAVLLLVCTADFPQKSQAAVRGQDRGGGDVACENRVIVVRDDLRKWIQEAGYLGLDLKGRGTAEDYKNRMIDSIEKTRIQCVRNGDPGFPVTVFGVPKTCAVDRRASRNDMICDFQKVIGHDDESLYRQVHHEFATLAGFEKPNGGISDYEISNQIAGYLVDQVVKRLAVLPAAKACLALDLRNAPVGTKCRTSKGAVFEKVFRLNFGEAWKEPDGLIWSDVVGRANHRTAFEICTEKLGAFFPSQYAYEKAEAFGFREVLPGFSGRRFWVATTDYIDTPVFFGDYGTVLATLDPSSELDFRCATRK